MKRNLRSFKDFAEKLYNDRASLENHMITWESFTEMLHAPLPMNKLEEMFWKQNRLVYKNLTNKAFIDLSLQCQLEVVFDDNKKERGVTLICGNNVSIKTMNKGTKKMLQCNRNQMERVEDVIKICPGAEKELNAYKQDLINAQYQLFGRLASNPDLAGKIDLVALRKLLPKE